MVRRNGLKAQGTRASSAIVLAGWGVEDEAGAEAGPIRILLDRTDLGVAPDSVRMTVDLAKAGFDSTDTYDATNGQSYDNAYRPNLHNLIFLWDTGDGGTWSAPENVLPPWKSKRYAKGPCVSHLYRSPGTYKINLTVIEPSSGKVAVAPETEIKVADPDEVFKGRRTICINPEGDTDFTGAPEGARRINADRIGGKNRTWNRTNQKAPKRWLFKRGGQFHVALHLTETAASGTLIGAYGTAKARPVLRGMRNGKCINLRNFASKTLKDLRLADLEFRGGFDPGKSRVSADTTSADQAIFIFQNTVDLMVSNCHFSGFRGPTLAGWRTKQRRLPCHVHLDDCRLTDFGGQYVVLVGPYLDGTSWVSFTGTAIVQSQSACSDDNDLRSPVRSNGAKYTHIRGCDFYHSKEAWPCLVLDNDPRFHGGKTIQGNLVNLQTSSCETGNEPIVLNGNIANVREGGLIMNAVIDSCIIIGNRITRCFVRCSGQGVTIRNCLGIQPAIPAIPVPGITAFENPFRAAVWASRDGKNPISETAPIRSYCNTWVIQRRADQNGGKTPKAVRNAPNRSFRDNGKFSDVSSENDVLHAPAFGSDLAQFAPLSETVLFAPRTPGVRPCATFVLNTDFAPPKGSIARYAPQTGSPALGAALQGRASLRTLDLGPRDMDPPSAGAWEIDTD